jgi:hypothetical protein
MNSFSPQIPPDDPAEYHIGEEDHPVLVYYVFEKPASAPEHWVVVPTLIKPNDDQIPGEAQQYLTLERAREAIPNRGRCKRFERNPDDPPQLIEAWIEVDGEGE